MLTLAPPPAKSSLLRPLSLWLLLLLALAWRSLHWRQSQALSKVDGSDESGQLTASVLP